MFARSLFSRLFTTTLTGMLLVATAFSSTKVLAIGQPASPTPSQNSDRNPGIDRAAVRQEIRQIDRYLRENPRDAEYYNLRGNRYVMLEEYRTAIRDYTSAVRLQPTRAVFYYNRGEAYIAVSNHRSAKADLNRAIALDSSDPDFFFSRAIAEMQLGERTAAAADLQKAKEMLAAAEPIDTEKIALIDRLLLRLNNTGVATNPNPQTTPTPTAGNTIALANNTRLSYLLSADSSSYPLTFDFQRLSATQGIDYKWTIASLGRSGRIQIAPNAIATSTKIENSFRANEQKQLTDSTCGFVSLQVLRDLKTTGSVNLTIDGVATTLQRQAQPSFDTFSIEGKIVPLVYAATPDRTTAIWILDVPNQLPLILKLRTPSYTTLLQATAIRR